MSNKTFTYKEPNGESKWVRIPAENLTLLRCPLCGWSAGFIDNHLTQEVDEVRLVIGGKEVGYLRKGDLKKVVFEQICAHCTHWYALDQSVQEQLVSEGAQ